MPDHFFCPCPRGLEQALAQELVGLGISDPQVTDGGVGFFGSFAQCYRINLHSRIAGRVLWRVWHGFYRTEDHIYRAAKNLRWSSWFSSDYSIRVKVSARHCPLKSLEFITLRIKDAICDQFRASGEQRPDVDTHQPDMRIQAFLRETDFFIYLDTSGESLFKRGLRHTAGEAPLRENLAAGILSLTGWKPGEPLLDPMCGSGTFLMEAAQISLGIAPGLRREFAFELFHDFDAWGYAEQRRQANALKQPMRFCDLYGSDISQQALDAAKDNLETAELDQAVRLHQCDVRDVQPPADAGVWLTNPPYGMRLGEQEELAELYPELGHVLKQRFVNWRAYFFTGDLSLAKLIRLSASKRTPLFNGPLECRLFEYLMVPGTNRRARNQVENSGSE